MQLRVSRSAPRHSSPPLRGAGSEHSRLRQWVQSSPQADHLLHGLQLPSTGRDRQAQSEQHGQRRKLARAACLCGPTSHLDQAGPAGLDLGTGPGSGPPVCGTLSVQLALMTHANGREAR